MSDPVSDDLWQSRPFRQTQVREFDRAAVIDSVAAFVHLGAVGAQRELSFIRYQMVAANWVTLPLGFATPVKAIALSADYAYLLADATLSRVDLARLARPDLFPIAQVSRDGFLTTIDGGVAAAFSDASELIWISQFGAIQRLQSPYPAFTCLGSVGHDLLCGIAGSTAVRMMSPAGLECGIFLGHCAPVTHLCSLSERMFASAAKDASVRVWDLRYRFPVISVTTHGIQTAAITGTSDFLICALENNSVATFDLRRPMGKAILGVETPGYEPVSLTFNQKEDNLAVFGMQPPNEGQMSAGGSSGLFRVYTRFIES
jgi:hypothetical protein